ncbi:GNAT family N-acetyltransferase [Chitinophaga sp. SYP-B3965]|uniref:GNAT family N-acetyltransferase n=1 Tax=Chitinophaga sp. SYP-B3965 TaxID=2663120 RepID=UPI0012996270|nr:GNAT family N-acetyltransferase [Chitinophaga sp. SYP-B3965]MRG49115.1 GNAT family N-acetyltransferase [Chitinophaga sp. SYP-B3965]
MPDIRLIEYGSCDYKAMVELRDKILRAPLGLTFSEEYLQQEISDVLIGCFEEEKLLGCCILTPLNETTVQLRQMAVDDNLQGKGTGSKVLRFAEEHAKRNGFQELMMHARKEAAPFYTKNGYLIRGSAFEEVGIAHYEMFKRL